MFYIHASRRDENRLKYVRITPTLIVLLAFVLITLWTMFDAIQSNVKKQEDALTRSLEQTTSEIQDHINSYENILRAGKGLFLSSDNVTREEWRNFVASFDLNNRYPGVLGIGYIEVIDQNELALHTQSVRQSGVLNYEVFPSNQNSRYASILYIEPNNDINSIAIGYDMYSEATRKAALDYAEKNNATTISDPVTLIQEIGPEKQPGLLMLVPIYQNVANQQKLKGFVYAPLRTYEFFNNSITTQSDTFAYRVVDVNSSNATELYATSNYQELLHKSHTEDTEQMLQVKNQTWNLSVANTRDILTTEEKNRPLTIFVWGTILSMFMALALYLLLVNRTIRIKQEQQVHIQAAKDELLALASHQLRTPATGVKQYLGLLRDGFAGTITAEQQTYIEKAYESNERQLDTINEMLFVAKTDTGHLVLNKDEVDLVELVNDILDEQQSAFETKKQLLVRSLPHNKVYAYLDKTYMRMAIENIVSNASKYTREHGRIEVRLERKGRQIIIAVKDTGVGIHKDDRSLLFQKFSRIPNEMTNKVSGSGIGLYLARTIIRAHNGTIAVSSSPEKGSTFTISFPVKHEKM